MSWMKARADAEERFLTYIPTNAPHGPFWAPDKVLQEALTAMEGHELPNFSPARREQLAAYFGMILNIDHNVGKLMAFLEEHRLAEDTILIFQTDNGSTFGHQ